MLHSCYFPYWTEQTGILNASSLLCRFCISLEGYHELTQTSGGSDLPRSYIAEGCQASLDQQWDIKRTPGVQPGAELSFKQLLQHQLSLHVMFYNYPESSAIKIK